MTPDPTETAVIQLYPFTGDQLPEIGSHVYIHLASIDRWVKHEVSAITVNARRGQVGLMLFRVNVHVAPISGCCAGSVNCRFLQDVRFDEYQHADQVHNTIPRKHSFYGKRLRSQI